MVRTETPEMIMDVGTDSPDIEVDQQESARLVRSQIKLAQYNDYVAIKSVVEASPKLYQTKPEFARSKSKTGNAL